MARPPPVTPPHNLATLASPRYIEKALRLIVESEVAATTAAASKPATENARSEQAQRKLNLWRAQHPEHELAYHEAIRQWQLLNNLAPALSSQFIEPPAMPRPLLQRRTLLSAFAGLLALGVIAKTGFWYWQQPVFEHTYQTAMAEVQRVGLPDGSHLDINAKSKLSVQLYRQKRVVNLAHGEVRFAVSHDARHPFSVQTREGEVKVVGTVFTVMDRGTAVRVTVEQGHVRFAATAGAAAPASQVPSTLDLYADQQVTIAGGHPGAIQQVAAADAAAWRDGWLVFNHVALADAILTLNPYRTSPLVLGDARTSQLRLTGRFLANNVEQLDRALPKILPLQLRKLPDGTTLLTTH